MGFGAAIGAFYSGYVKFDGRSCRSEYWWSFLFKTLVYLGIFFVAVIIAAIAEINEVSSDASAAAGGGFVMCAFMFYLVNYLPNLAIKIRRFHDQNQSGWMVLLGYIPYVGRLIVLVFMILDGTHGENQYGEDPLGENLYETFS